MCQSFQAHTNAESRAIGDARDRLGLPDVVDRRDPQVENAVKRRAPASGAVGLRRSNPRSGYSEETPGRMGYDSSRAKATLQPRTVQCRGNKGCQAMPTTQCKSPTIHLL